MRRAARKKTNVSMKFIKNSEDINIDIEGALAAYSHVNNKIFLYNKLRTCNKDFAAYVFAHEIGHSIDKSTNYELYIKSQKAMNFVEHCLYFKTKIPKKIAHLVMRSEIAACLYGEKFLNENKIKLKKGPKVFRNEIIDVYSDLLNIII